MANIIMCDGHLGYVDWGRGGKADKWCDIAFCVRNIRENLNDERYVSSFFKLLGLVPDWDKINYHLLMDMLF